MRALAGVGDRIQALSVYEALRVGMRDEFGMDPEVATRDLYRTILCSDEFPEPAWERDEIDALLQLLRRALESDSTLITGLPSMQVVGELLHSRAG
jgi:DNA-binding SARP family transcriptional activator